MANSYFSFKQFTINQERAAFKVGTDGVLLGAVADTGGAKRILDIGSGSGLIAIMLAQRSGAAISAIEPESYIQCLENVKLCKWKERISVEHTDLQNYQPAERFDIAVINPPYFSDSLKNPDPRKSVSRHNDSLTNSDLLKNVSKILTGTGRLQLIMPYIEGNIFIADAAGFGFYCNNILKIRPLPSSPIRRMILTFSRQLLPPTEKLLTIEHGKRHEFTEEYINLTKDFYLKF
jgi:tRNA1Val (adenine37-N6)-methyltransferase